MKITLIRKDEEQGTEALSLCDTDAFFEKVKTENKAGHISELREILPRLAGSSARYVHIDKLPRVYPAVEYTRKQKGEKRMKHYNGLVQLEVNRLADLYEVEYVKRQVEQLPQTFAAFCGSSGRSVKIWIRFARTDGSLPTATQEVLLFHAHAYRLAVTCYQPMLPFGITLKEPDLMQSCRMTVDEQPYYNPSSAPFCIEQPLTLPDEETFRQRKQNSESAPERMTPGCESMQIFAQIWIRFARTDGSLPTATQEVLLFHAHAYRLAVTCYQPMLPFGITLKEPDLMQSCRMTVDEQPYYNPSSAPFCIEQPLTLPDEETFRQRKQNSESAPERMTPGCESMQIFAQMYQSARKRALAEMENWKRDDGLEPLLPHLVEQCFKTGIPEEEAVQRTLMHYFHATDTETIRTAFGNGYREMKGFGKKSGFSKEQEATFRLEEFLKRRYEFRFNTVLDEVEYRQRDSVHFYFKPLDKRTRNSIALCALKEGLQVWDRDIDRFLTSDFVPLYNPVEEYLCDLPRWDGTDRIRALARLVPCGNPHWEELFYRWFLGMVAHWRGMDRQHGNSTSPLLVGSQGFRKSTYCRILLPPELRFGYADSLDFSSKQEAERALGRFFLINLDEFDQITVNQQGFLKHLLQKPTANLRKPYGTSVRELRRYASFIGTSNQKDLLTDPTGSRRFICIEVTDPIDTNVTIDYRQLYAQAMHLLYKNERYWLNDEDEAVLRQSNSEFEQISPLEHLFHCNFSSATNEKEGEWMTAMDIFNYLQENTRDKLSINKINWFGRILRKLNIPKKTSTRGTLYHVTKLK